MLNLDIVNSFVMEFFSLVSISNNGTHWHARCPLCGDSKKNTRKKRFHLDYNQGNPIWQCFNCSRSGSFLEIYSELKGISKDDAKSELYGFNSLRDRLTNREIFLNEVQKRNKINYETFNWIREQSISRFQDVEGIILRKYKSILDRFCRDRLIPDQYDILISYTGDFKGRIIVPVVDADDNVIYFQGRRVPGSGVEPKYKNPTVEKSTIILNEHKFDENKPIIVTEGLIDAFMIGDQGTSCLGSFFSDDFISVIFPYTKNGVILAFDNPFTDDAGYKSMIRFILGVESSKGQKKKQPSKYRNIVKYFLPEKQHRDSKDINIMRVEYGIENMYSYVVKNSYSMTHAYSMLKLERRK